MRPCHLKSFDLILESRYHIVCIQVVYFELLDDHKHEEVEHYKGAYHHVGDKEKRAISWATVLSLDTSIRLRLHCVLHHAVPIFSCAHTNEEDHAVAEIWEIIVLIYYLVTLSDVLEECTAQNAEYEVYQEQESEHIEQGRQWKLNSWK